MNRTKENQLKRKVSELESKWNLEGKQVQSINKNIKTLKDNLKEKQKQQKITFNDFQKTQKEWFEEKRRNDRLHFQEKQKERLKKK